MHWHEDYNERGPCCRRALIVSCFAATFLAVPCSPTSHPPHSGMVRLFALLTLLTLSHRAVASETDLNLVIAVDCSYSVDAREYALQIAGIAQVFADPDIAAAIEQGPRGAIGVLIVQWSSRDTQIVTQPWTRLASRQDALDYAARVAPQQRETYDAGTAIASVLTFSNDQLMRAPFVATRSVINIITDGKDNYRKPVRPVRDAIVAQGVTINALAVLNQVSDLVDYLGERVIGGDGAFVEEAASYEDFAEAFKRKLLREIGEPRFAGVGRTPSFSLAGRRAKIRLSLLPLESTVTSSYMKVNWEGASYVKTIENNSLYGFRTLCGVCGSFCHLSQRNSGVYASQCSDRIRGVFRHVDAVRSNDATGIQIGDADAPISPQAHRLCRSSVAGKSGGVVRT